MAIGFSTGIDSTGAVTSTETSAVLANSAGILALADTVRWLKKKLASLSDLHVEPDDMLAEDAMKNMEREA